MDHRTDDRLDRLDSRLTELELALEFARADARRAESRARRTTLVLGGALALAATVAAIGPQRIVDVVQTARLEVVDDDGRVVASLTAGERGGQLDLWDDAGRNVLRAAANRHGADLALWSAAGESVAGLYATPDGGRLTVHATDGATVARLGANGDGGALHLADTNGAGAVALSADASGGALDLGGGGLGEGGRAPSASLRGHAAGGSLALGAEGNAALLASAESDRAVVRVTGDGASAGLVAGSAMTMFGAELDGGTGVRISATPTTGPVVRLGRGDGPVVQLDAADGAGRLSLDAGDGRRATVAANEGLRLVGRGGSDIARVFDDAGRGRLTLHDGDGRVAAGIDAGGSGRGSSFHLDHAGERIFAVGATPMGGLMNIMNRRGRSVFAAGVTNGGADGGGLSLLNADGTPIVTAGVASDRGGHVSVYSADGTLMRMFSPPPR